MSTHELATIEISRRMGLQAEGCADKSVYDKKFGADLWQVDVEQYDKVGSGLSSGSYEARSSLLEVAY